MIFNAIEPQKRAKKLAGKLEDVTSTSCNAITFV